MTYEECKRQLRTLLKTPHVEARRVNSEVKDARLTYFEVGIVTKGLFTALGVGHSWEEAVSDMLKRQKVKS